MSLFISALGKLNHVSKSSCFDIIKELAKKLIITESTKHKLLYALSIAGQVRLTVYMRKKSQRDHVNIQTFLEMIGPFITLNYFQITYCLQCLIAKCLSFSKFHFYSEPQLINITLLYAFGMNKLATPLLVKKFMDKNIWALSTFSFDSCLKQLESQIHEVIIYHQNELHNMSKIPTFDNSFEVVKSYINQLPCMRPVVEVCEATWLSVVAQQLAESYLFDEALEFFRHALCIQESNPIMHTVPASKTNLSIGECLNELNRPKRSFNPYFNFCEIIFEKTIGERYYIGCCYGTSFNRCIFFEIMPFESVVE